MRPRSCSRGFTLIELLIVVAIIGIVVAISIVNMINAIERARQRRTMADMRSISTAVEAYGADNNRFPPSAAFTLPPGLALPSITIGFAGNYLSPTYIKVVPLVDGWKSWLLYSVTAEGTDFGIRSYGKDGLPQESPSYGRTTDFNADIIMIDGVFVQYPEGVQQ